MYLSIKIYIWICKYMDRTWLKTCNCRSIIAAWVTGVRPWYPYICDYILMLNIHTCVFTFPSHFFLSHTLSLSLSRTHNPMDRRAFCLFLSLFRPLLPASPSLSHTYLHTHTHARSRQLFQAIQAIIMIIWISDVTYVPQCNSPRRLPNEARLIHICHDSYVSR